MSYEYSYLPLNVWVMNISFIQPFYFESCESSSMDLKKFYNGLESDFSKFAYSIKMIRTLFFCSLKSEILTLLPGKKL